MSSFSLVFPVVLGVVTFFHIFYGLALWRKDNSLADMAWGLGGAFAAWLALAQLGFPAMALAGREWLLVLLVTLWGLRLTLHIFVRNWGRGEDARYAAWRKGWGAAAWWKGYLQVFLLQSLLILLVSLPAWLGILLPGVRGWTALDGIGLGVWGVGWLFEALADWQLLQFKKSGKRGVLQTGVWRYSRHPNYFGEVTLWWGLWLIALGQDGGAFTVIGPVLISTLILFVSGVPLLEKRYAKDKAYQAYARRTSVFVPWWPKAG